MIAPSKMMLHCGAEEVSRDAVWEVVTPEPTESHYPMAHNTFVESIEHNLTKVGFGIVHQEHSLSHDGDRYFGLFHLDANGPAGDYGWLMGLRNSHDKSYSAGIVAGTRVFVCDNLGFSGTIKLNRKHTKNVEKDFNNLVFTAVGRLGDKLVETDRRIECYKQRELTDGDAAEFVIEATAKSRAAAPTRIPMIWENWKNPEHDDFKPRTAWSLMNAFTESSKGLKAATQISRGEVLHGMMDGLSGVCYADS